MYQRTSRCLPTAIGDVRTEDLVAACHSSAKRLPARPSVLSNDLENPSANRVESASQMHGGIVVACSANISEADFQRIELWLAKKRTGTGYECGGEYEPLTPVDDSVVCALILDGSFRWRSVMLGLERLA